MIVGVCMARNEEDIIDTVLRHTLAEGVDHLIVADNLSTDNTRSILLQLVEDGLPVTVLEDRVVAYEQAAKMSRLAARAHAMGADWVLPFDADEIWYAPGGSIAEALGAIDPGVTIVRVPGWDHIHRGDGIAWTESPTVNPHACMGGPFSPWRRAQTQQLAKVCFRSTEGAMLHMGNHDVQIPGPSVAGPLAFRHFQYRSLEQMTDKLRHGRRAYEASDIHPMHGTHWRQGGLKTDAELKADWQDLCSEEGLIYDPAPIRVSV